MHLNTIFHIDFGYHIDMVLRQNLYAYQISVFSFHQNFWFSHLQPKAMQENPYSKQPPFSKNCYPTPTKQ